MTKETLEQLEKRATEKGCAITRNGDMEGLIMGNGGELRYYVQKWSMRDKRVVVRTRFAEIMGI